MRADSSTRIPAEWKPFINGENDLRAIRAGYKLDLQHGRAMASFFPKFLRHSKGEWDGKPFDLLDWELNRLVIPLFGWKKPNGLRRFNKVSVWLPKKNGKSALVSGLALLFLIADNEPGAEVYCAACDKSQASIVFNEAAEMVRRSPDIIGMIGEKNIIPSTKTIKCGTNSWIKALSADVPTKEGLNASFIVVDELHAHKSRSLFDTLKYSGRARRQPVFVIISTAGDEAMGVGHEEYEEAREVQAGRRDDPHTLAIVYEPGPKDSWKSEKTWAKCNPSLGHTITIDTLRDDYRRALGSPQKIATFKRYSLNMWVRSSNPWLDMDLWERCNGGEVTEDDIEGPVYGGIDLASTRDTTAFVLAWGEPDNVKLFPMIYMPEDGIEDAEARDHVPYREWADAGLLKLTPGPRTDYRYVQADVLRVMERFDLREIAIDPWMAQVFAAELVEKHGAPIVEMRQGWATMSEPIKQFDKMIAMKQINHGGHKVLTWQASNAAIKSDPSENVRLIKDDGKTKRKIDALVAAVMAVARLRAGDAEAGNVYDSRGLLVL